jgi:pimeloyl-ACP methyl ester carboxylesterase
MRCWTRRSVIAAGLSLAGCAAFDRSQQAVTYASVTRPDDQPPLILVPGAFGSSLRECSSGREIWPVSDSRLLFSDYRELALPIDPATLEPDANDAEAYAVFREGLGHDFYGGVIDMLRRVGGYERCVPGTPPRDAGGCGLYLYLYDFRLDNVRAARGLADLIARIRDDWGDPQLKVDVVAHSNGGMVARYYVRHGAQELPATGELEPTYAGAAAIRRLLLVGTPSLGTLQPVLSLLRGEEIGLRRIPPEVVATCTGITEMMPHPAVPWLIDLQGNRVDADLYDVATWRDFGWSLFDPNIAERTIANHGGGAEGRRYLDMLREYLARNLGRGQKFATSFATRPDPRDVPTWVFGGDCEPTLARLVVENVGNRFRARERVVDIAAPAARDLERLMHEPGDSVVTRSSLLGRRAPDVAAPHGMEESLQIAHTLFFCEQHQQLTGNAGFQDKMLHALFSVDATAQ